MRKIEKLTPIRCVIGLLAVFLCAATASYAAQTIRVYGPGGPLPAVQEAADAFHKRTGTEVIVVGGPTAKWIDQAKENADILFSGSETMMTDFAMAMNGKVAAEEVQPLYLRPSAILVRPGNPKKIGGLKDLFAPGHKILVVNGAGQNGLWEDIAGRLGDVRSVRALRSNIKGFAANSAEARKLWTEDASYDAWIIWNIWQVSNKSLADVVPIEPEYRIYRDTGIVLTASGKSRPEARAFAEFLASTDGRVIFEKWGWIGADGAN